MTAAELKRLQTNPKTVRASPTALTGITEGSRPAQARVTAGAQAEVRARREVPTELEGGRT